MEDIALRFDVGVIADAFDPLTQLKVDCLLSAANMCERLVVIIRDDPAHCRTEIRQRYRWVYETLNHFPDVRLLPISDGNKISENEWLCRHRDEIRKAAEREISVVLTIDQDVENSPWPEALGTGNIIRLDCLWNNEPVPPPSLPSWVQPYFVKKVLITGVESTGKTTLANSLAKHYNIVWVEEAGR